MTLIFDIGFNRGEFASVCAKQFPGCRIIGVEANKHLYYDAPSIEGLTVLNRLVSDEGGTQVEFFIEYAQDGISTASKDFMEYSRFSKGSKYLAPHSGRWLSAGPVPTITLDEMIVEYGIPNITKIDVEGYEYEVLTGLTKKIEKICFECHEEEKDKLHKIIVHLKRLGYLNFGFIGVFEEGDIFEKLTFSDKGDPYLVEPDEYYSWATLEEDMDICFKPDRRINYGMVWCR